MTTGAYPRKRVEDVLIKVKLPASYRIIPRRHFDTPLGVELADSRFCAKADGYAILYATPDFAAAFIEVIVRFARKKHRELLLKEVTERAWARIVTKPRTKLALLDLRNDGCVRLGAPTDAVKARNHAAGRGLGRAIHVEHKDIDGFIFSSRLTDADVYAIFDRGISKLAATDTELLSNHPDLPALLSDYEIRLLAT